MKVYFFMLFALFIMFPNKAYAFGNKGHQRICQLAYQSLSISQQLTIDKITKQIPTQYKRLINKRLNRTKDHNIHFSDSCIWPDIIRSIKAFKKFSTWHYVNLSRDSVYIDKSPCNKNCVSSAILFHYNKVKELDKNDSQLWQPILFTSHWIGDIHQPLHVSFKSDKGGNKSNIKFNHSIKNLSCKNLHSLWDRCLLSYSKNQLPFKATQFKFLATDKLTPANVLIWAEESLTIARMPSTFYCNHKNHSSTCFPYKKTVMIDQIYLHKNAKILQARINQAAKRLSLFLQEI